MNEYEVYVVEINPCGGEGHARKSFIEVEAESPESYVRENGRLPITDIGRDSNGDVVITTADGNGYMVRYTFTG